MPNFFSFKDQGFIRCLELRISLNKGEKNYLFLTSLSNFLRQLPVTSMFLLNKIVKIFRDSFQELIQ
jgi:hypothetical protein